MSKDSSFNKKLKINKSWKSSKKNDKEIERLTKLRLLSMKKKKNSKKKTSIKKNNRLKDEAKLENKINEHFENNLTNNNDKLFCDSFQECSKNVLSYIGFANLPTVLKEKINDSIANFSYLLKLSFLESIKLAVSIFGIVAFSIPSLEKIYKKGKNISNDLYNQISSMSSKVKDKLIDNVSKIGNISPLKLLKSIKNIILNHKILTSISTVCLVIFSIQFCQITNSKGGLKKFDEHFSFIDILKNNLNFFPLNTSLGKVIIEYTGMFIDNSREIVNKIIDPLNRVCQLSLRKKKIEISEVEPINIKRFLEPSISNEDRVIILKENSKEEKDKFCNSLEYKDCEDEKSFCISKMWSSKCLYNEEQEQQFIDSINNKCPKNKCLCPEEMPYSYTYRKSRKYCTKNRKSIKLSFYTSKMLHFIKLSQLKKDLKHIQKELKELGFSVVLKKYIVGIGKDFLMSTIKKTVFLHLSDYFRDIYKIFTGSFCKKPIDGLYKTIESFEPEQRQKVRQGIVKETKKGYSNLVDEINRYKDVDNVKFDFQKFLVKKLDQSYFSKVLFFNLVLNYKKVTLSERLAKSLQMYLLEELSTTLPEFFEDILQIFKPFLFQILKLLKLSDKNIVTGVYNIYWLMDNFIRVFLEIINYYISYLLTHSAGLDMKMVCEFLEKKLLKKLVSYILNDIVFLSISKLSHLTESFIIHVLKYCKTDNKGKQKLVSENPKVTQKKTDGQ